MGGLGEAPSIKGMNMGEFMDRLNIFSAGYSIGLRKDRPMFASLNIIDVSGVAGGSSPDLKACCPLRCSLLYHKGMEAC